MGQKKEKTARKFAKRIFFVRIRCIYFILKNKQYMKKTVYGLIVGCLAMLGTVVMAQSATPTQGDSWDPNAGENWTQQGPG